MKAVQCQEESCVTILLEHGADPNCMDRNGNTALHYAAVGQNVSIVEKLLSYNVDIEGRNKEELTPFLVAVAGNKQQMVQFLLERGANMHAIDIYKRTALMLAVTYECTDIVKLLLQKGINIFLEAECGWTAEEYATVSGFHVIRQLIAEHREAIGLKNCTQNRNPAVDESSEDTLSRLSVCHGANDAWPTSGDGNVNIKEGEVLSAVVKKDNGIDIESAPREQTVNDNLTSADRAYKNNGDVMGIGLGEEEESESPWDSETDSETLPKKYVNHLSGTADQKGPSILNEQLADLSAERNLEMTSEEEQERLGESENKHLQMDEERKRHESDKLAVSESISAAAATGLIQKRASGKTDNHLCPIMEDEDSDGPAKKTSKEKKEVKKEINFMDDFDDLTPSSGTASEDYSVNLLKIQDAVLSCERLVEVKKNHCEQLTRKNKDMESGVNGLQKELSETKEIKSQLEQQKVEWEQELCSSRFSFKQEKERRRNTDMLYEKIKEQLKRKLQQYNKEAELKQQLEVTLRTWDEELRTVRNNLNQIFNSRRKEKGLLHKNHRSQDQIAMLRLEIDTINNQNREKEKKYCEDIAIIKEKIASLQKTIKLNEETFRKTIFQYSGQINALTAENTMLKSKLEGKKENKERLHAKVESCRARLASAIQDRDQIQTAKRDLELTFQRAKDEWVRVQEELNFDVSKLKDNNELLSQNLSKTEGQLNTLEMELHHTRDALREKTLVLERVQGDLSHTQCQKKEIEHMYRNEQDKVNKYIAQQESLEERLSQLQSENMLLQQQRDDAYNKAASKEKIVINIQDQFQDILKKLQAESEKQGLMLEERNEKLINEFNLLKERIYHYEKEKVEREVSRESDDIKGERKKFIELTQSLEHYLNHDMKKNGELEKEITRLKKLLSMTRSEVDDLTAKLETASSKCLQLDEKNQVLSQKLLSMKEIQKKCEKLEKNKKKLEQQVAILKSHARVNMAEYSRIEQYKQELDERAQIASQESLGQLRDSNNALINSQMELRMKDLEFELFKMKSSQEHSNKTELEKCKQPYVEEVKDRTSLKNELKRHDERLEEIRIELLMGRLQRRNGLHTVAVNPILELPYVGNISNGLPLNRHVAPRENVMIPTSSSCPSNNGIDSYLLKVEQEFEKNISRALKAGADEFESDSSYHTSSSERFLQNLRSRYRI